MPPKRNTASTRYTHLSQRNQILKRPGQHIGSITNSVRSVWLAETEYRDNEEIERIVEREIEYNPGLIHIFYEVLSNAQDNYFRSKDSDFPLKCIKVYVDQESGKITVWNDGLWIPTRIHEWGTDEEVIDTQPHYEAEIIFGQLNSSSNYNDDEEARVGGGLHGVGVKLTNIFSTWFKVETFDPDSGLRFAQEYTNNMEKTGKVKITKLKQKKGYTQISYVADFTKFKVDGYSDNLVAVMKKLCVDCAMSTGAKIVFNDETIPVKNLISYAGMYTDTLKIEFKSDDCTVVLAEKPAFEPGFTHVSFVNGINTARGGVHVERWRSAIFKPLLEKLKAKFSGKGKQSTPFKITAKNLENYFMLFVNCNVENPEFEGQTKSILSSPAPHVNVPDSKIKALLRWGFLEEIEEMVKIQGMRELKKTDGKKSSSVSVEKADDANKAGTAQSQKCTLFITEGLSALEFAVKGITTFENGRDYYGVLPIKGKLLNVQKAKADQINNNTEITALKKMLGLQHGIDYTDDAAFKSLRYGKVRILTDADLDGDHIKGLIINFFQYFYPSLITRKYLASLRTPLIKVKNGRKQLTFYFAKDYKEWAAKQSGKINPEYYKGLGTCEDSDIIEIFSEPRYVQYLTDNHTAESVNMIFSTKRSDDRKEWLENYEEHDFVYPEKNGEERVSISDFFNNEMISFSIYDNQRSIPNVVDGLKPSQRKVLWVGLQELSRTQKYKVAQFGSEVAKRAKYHHGEISLEQTVIGMAQTFVGSNNIAVFLEKGQFGTRNHGGKNAASGRYIYIQEPSITRKIYRPEDDPILEKQYEEGAQIEPRYFVPIIPMLLVNGCSGIGTGYSTNIPSFNPLDLVEWIRVWLNAEGAEDAAYPDLVPWYWGFVGRTERDPNNPQRFHHYGNVQQIAKNHYRITELPVGVWTSDYKQHLESLKSGLATTKKTTTTKTGYNAMTVMQLREELENRQLAKTGTKKQLIEKLKKHDLQNGTTAKKTGHSGQLISKFEEHGGAYNVDLHVWTRDGFEVECTPQWKLVSTETLTNMTAFTPRGGLHKYADLHEIMHTFCNVRYELYQTRKKHLVKVLQQKLAEQEAKARFIKDVLRDFSLLKQTTKELHGYLASAGYHKKDDGYNYLTSMAIGTLNSDKRQALLTDIEKIKAEIDYVRKKSAKQMWLTELGDFVTTYKTWKREIEETHQQLAKARGKPRGKK